MRAERHDRRRVNRRDSGAVTGEVSVAMNQAREATLRALYDDHAHALLGYAIRLTNGDRGRAEDIVQETLIRAWRNADAFEQSRGPVRPWLFTVARRIAIDAHRSRAVRPTEVGDAVLALVPASGDVESSLDRIVLTDALGSLSAEHRSVIVQTYYRGHSVAEAAAALGVPVGTVKSRSYYALRALKLALAERGVST
jgi:RNA polymerase sigma-70 factor (ECF subfamily)